MELVSLDVQLTKSLAETFLPLSATGCLLPLAMNHGEDRTTLWVLTRALTELGGSWHYDAVYGPQGVDALKHKITKLIGFGRRESPMNPEELATMTGVLGPYLTGASGLSPVVECGHDGYLLFSEMEQSRFLDGWITASIWYPEPSDEPEDWPPTDGIWRPGVTYSSDIELELARWIGRSSPPRIFLLWTPTI
jgi:hypothetical protein